MAATVRRVVGKRLHHVVSFESGLLHGHLHHGHSLNTGLRVKVAVHADNISTWGQKGKKRVRLNRTVAGRKTKCANVMIKQKVFLVALMVI